MKIRALTFHRSEIAFLGYLLVVGLGGFAMTFVAESNLVAIAESANNPVISGYVETGKQLIAISCAGLAFAFFCGLIVVYPMVRRSAHEQGRLSEVSQDLAKKSETFQHAALTDPLTGLQNRRYFDDALSQYLEEFAAIDHPLGMIVMDLDHFKTVNDTYGHDVGDDVLRGVTKCLLDYTRYHDVVARVGGEEFAILAPNLDQRSLQRLADRIRVAVSEITFDAENVRFRVTTSMGIALWDGTESSNAFVKRADLKLYEAKTSGRNRAVA